MYKAYFRGTYRKSVFGQRREDREDAEGLLRMVRHPDPPRRRARVALEVGKRMVANSSDAICASGGSGAATVRSRLGVAHGLFLRTIDTVDQANDGRCQEQRAGNNDGIVEDLNEHDAGSFLRAFSMVLLCAFIGVLYIDKNAKVGVLYLCSFMYMY